MISKQFHTLQQAETKVFFPQLMELRYCNIGGRMRYVSLLLCCTLRFNVLSNINYFKWSEVKTKKDQIFSVFSEFFALFTK